MANTESNVGARLFLIGKAGVLSGIKEIQAATAKLNAEIAAGARSSKVAQAANAEQMLGLSKLGKTMDAYQANLARNAAGQDALASVGKKAFFGLTAAAVLAGYESIKWASAYQTQLVRLRTQAGLTVGAMNQIGAAAMKNSSALGITPTQYVTAAYHPASTGVGTRQTIAITNASAMLAGIGGSDIEDTTNAVTGIMKNYNYRGQNSARNTAALVNAIVGAGNMHMSDFNAAAASGIFATAKTFGVSPQSVGGALAYMTDRGVPAAQAGTHLRMSMALLGAPSHIAQKFLTDAGMSKTEAQDRTNALAQTLSAAGLSTTSLSSDLRNNSGGGGIYNALADLHKHLSSSDMSPELQAAFISRSFGGGKMGTSIEMMYNNIAGLKLKTGQIDNNAKSAKFMKDWAAYTHTARYETKALGSEVETLGIKLGTELLPPALAVVRGLTSFLKFMQRNKDLAYALGTVITAVLVPAIGVYLFRALLSSGGAIRTVMTGYANLIRGQTAERISLAETDASLTGTTVATGRLAAADDALAASSKGGLGGMASKGIGAGGYLAAATAGYAAYQGTSYMLKHNIGGSGTDVTNWGVNAANWLGMGPKQVASQHTKALLAPATIKFLDDVATGKTHNNQITESAAKLELKTAGLKIPKGRFLIEARVYLDGKQLTNSVVKTVKQTAARN
jgi:hypothetical protein